MNSPLQHAFILSLPFYHEYERHVSLLFVFFLECLSKPIGPSHTAVSRTACENGVDLGNECASECADVRYGVQYPASYFCSNVQNSHYKVEFQFLTIVSGVIIESACDDCKLTTFKPLYRQSKSRDWMKIFYHVSHFDFNHWPLI